MSRQLAMRAGSGAKLALTGIGSIAVLQSQDASTRRVRQCVHPYTADKRTGGCPPTQPSNLTHLLSRPHLGARLFGLARDAETADLMMGAGAKRHAAGKRSGLKGGNVSKIGARRTLEGKHADGGAVPLEMQVHSASMTAWRGLPFGLPVQTRLAGASRHWGILVGRQSRCVAWGHKP